VPAPRSNPDLTGHETAERELRQLFGSGRMPHALLLSGPRGIGKATLAFRLARHVLANPGADTGGMLFGGDTQAAGEGLAIAPESGVFRRVASGGHADLLTVERAYDSRRRRLRTEIVVDDSREIATFLRLTPAEGGWRVVVIDGADAMNRSAANAVLKILEEPPRQALLLLVAHSPGRLLPTIRSRCRRFPLAPLSALTVRELLGRYRPDLAATEAGAVVALADGSIGRALELAATGGVDLYRAALALLSRQQGLDIAALHAFADRLIRPDAEGAYRAVEELLAQFLARLAIASARGGFAADAAMPSDLAAGEAAAMRRLGMHAARWAVLHDEIGDGFARADGLNLDRKQAILGAFFAIERAAG